MHDLNDSASATTVHVCEDPLLHFVTHARVARALILNRTCHECTLRLDMCAHPFLCAALCVRHKGMSNAHYYYYDTKRVSDASQVSLRPFLMAYSIVCMMHEASS